jgi:hypothetical protein
VTNTFGGTGAVDGRGRCLRAPQLQVRVYFRGNVEPAASVPVDGQSLLLGAPCQMVHVANVVWPPRLLPDGSPPGPGDDLGAPTVEAVEAPQPVQAYGERGNGGLACAPNGQRTPAGQPIPWYDPAP